MYTWFEGSGKKATRADKDLKSIEAPPGFRLGVSGLQGFRVFSTLRVNSFYH